MYVVIYDINYTKVIDTYEIVVHSYPLLRLTQEPSNAIDIGIPTAFKFNYKLPSTTTAPKLIKFVTSDLTNKNCKANPLVPGTAASG